MGVSKLGVLTSCTLRDTLELVRRVVKTRWALLAERRLLIRR